MNLAPDLAAETAVPTAAKVAAEIADWAVSGRPMPGETEFGDLHVVAAFPGGALFGLIDGLGHGTEAAIASRKAAKMLAADPARHVTSLIQACHEALRPTRGAVLSLAAIDAKRGELTWAGVGNVEAVLYRADLNRHPRRERIMLRNGVVGYHLPGLKAFTLPVFPGDVLVFASDGLRHQFGDDAPPPGPAAAYAEHLLRTYAKDNDDALALVARYNGGAA